MRVTLIHNPGAGDGTSDPAAIERAIRSAGHDVRGVSIDAADWTAKLCEPADLVAVCGGDGTIGRVAKRMVGRAVPLAAFVAGTANNIAMTLGVEALSAQQQIEAWPAARRFAFDVAMATGPWGCEPLVEGLGCGLLASSIRLADAQDDATRALAPAQRLARSLQVLKERVSAFAKTHVNATIDGRDISGDYVLFEVMNTQFVGPNLFLAPDGRADDGMLDVVLVGDTDRARLRDHLSSWQRGAMRVSPPLESARGRVLTMTSSGFDIHLDDKLWPEQSAPERASETTIEIRVEQHAIEFLVP